MKILISGASGFIGTNLRQYLDKHMPGITFCMLVRKKTGAGREVLWEDLHTTSLDDIDAVIHLAGLAHDTKNTNDDAAYFLVNFELTKMLYDWFLKSKAKRFIYVSSVKAIADVVQGVLTEEAEPSPVTAYGKSKLKAEEYIQQLSLGVTDKKFYILRPCMVHGPGNKGNLNLFYKFVLKGLPYPLGAFENTRSFLSVDNFCFVCEQLLTEDIPSGAYNLADDHPLSTKELFNIIADTSQRKARIWNIPRGLVRTMACTGGLFKLPVNAERLEKLTESYVVCNRKIKAALKIKTMPVGVKEGIARTISSFEK
ncbi:MAG: NAD-dependent epimerase/dehydratase family protein [Chitinophagales bacterium]|nr:NAD-dependent epimerase/dehydratase family protein [Chitinophagales bacterium]